MRPTYFPAEGEYKVFTEDFKLVAEGFNSKNEALEYIAEQTKEKIYDIYVMWNREYDWCHYGLHLGSKGLKEREREILFQGDGARVKKVKSILRE